jgi:ligand-binding sensor domain-containing protein
MTGKFRLLLLLKLLLCFHKSYSQDYEFIYLAENQGLNNSEISCLAHSKQGIIFLGTINGISKFNSRNFSNYNLLDSNNNNYIVSMTENNNILYFSTLSGLYSFDGQTFHKLDNHSKIYSIKYNEKDNHLYYSIKNSIYKLPVTHTNPQPYKVCSISDSNVIIKHISIQSDKSIFLSCNQGLYHYKATLNLFQLSALPSFYTYLDKKNKLYNVTFNTIEKYNQNLILENKIFFRQDLIQKYNLNQSYLKVYVSSSSDNLYIYAPILAHNFIKYNDKNLADALNESTHIYHAEINDTLLRIKNKFKTPESLRNPSAIMADDANNLWVSTFEGLYQCRIPEKRYSYNYLPTKYKVGNISILNNKVSFSDQSFNIYILNKNFEIDSLSLKPLFNKLKENLAGTVYGMLSDSFGNVLIATLKKGIVIQTRKKEIVFNKETANVSFMCMTKDQHGDIYIAGNGGIYKWKDENLIKVSTINDIEESYIFDIQSKGDELYIASSSGLYKINKKGIENISKRSGINNFTFSSLCFTKTNQLIAGTYENGIYIFDDINGKYQFVKNINKNDGLNSNSINSIVCDKLNRIWICNSKNINILIQDKFHSKVIPFQSNLLFQSNIWSEQKLFIDSSNTIYIGGKNGVIYFSASNYIIDTFNSHFTLIEDVRVNNNKIKPTHSNQNHPLVGVQDNLTFSYFENNISFEYAAVNYSDSKIAYQYYLEGIENEWNAPSSAYQVNYKNLPPGKYTFHVRHSAFNNWSKPTTYRFTILPAWWNTIPFYILCFVLLSSVLYFSFKLRIKKINKKHDNLIQELNIKNKNLSLQSAALLNQMKPHFIFNALAPLQKYIYTSDKEKGIEYLNTFSNLLRNMLNQTRSTTTSINSEVNFITEYLKQQQNEKNNKFSFTIKNNILGYTKIPSLMIQPIIENCIQHGFPANTPGTLEIIFNKINENYISVKIQENGPGFDLLNYLQTNNNRALNIIYDRILLFKQLPSYANTKIIASHTNNNFIISLDLPIIAENEN